jgi:hypothetical protein
MFRCHGIYPQEECQVPAGRNSVISIVLLLAGAAFVNGAFAQKSTRKIDQRIVVSDNKHFLQYENGEPFFWLGDTGWLLFEKLTREELLRYLDNRAGKGFNVIQCVVVHALPLVDAYGDSAFKGNDLARPKVTPGHLPSVPGEYDFWDHIEYGIDRAAEKGIRVALVPIWGSTALRSNAPPDKIAAYARFLGERFGAKPNIFWINGGDIQGNRRPEIWNAIGSAIKAVDSVHLMTFHPFGRTQSSTWFHNAPWLDFNMFQSGHRRYDQRRGDGAESWKGEDNWRYVLEDRARIPAKPTLDGEPSYENIPQGLHDTTQPYWTASDCRRYAYWSVFAGSCGHTYGDNAVMQMYRPGDATRAYGARNYWFGAMDDPGASQMQYVAQLVLSRPYFERAYDSTLVVDQSTRYDFVPAMRGKGHLFAYTYTGRPFTLRMGRISGRTVRASWYDPRTGTLQEIGEVANVGTVRFQPPGGRRDGNDWVLVLDDAVRRVQ